MARYNLKVAKESALSILKESWDEIENVFTEHIRCKLQYKGEIVIDRDGAEKRLQNATFVDKDDKEVDETGTRLYNGMTDGETIWIDKECVVEEMIATLIHEALHDCVFLVRPTRCMSLRNLSCDFEHSVFTYLPIEGIN